MLECTLLPLTKYSLLYRRTGFKHELHDSAFVLMIGVAGGLSAGRRTETDPRTLLARDDTSNGSHAVLTMSTISLLKFNNSKEL